MAEKSYMDCGVQTDSPLLASAQVQADLHAPSPYHIIAAVDIRGEPTTLSELILASPGTRRRSTSSTLQDESAYIDVDQSSLDETDEPLDDSVDMRSITRLFERQSLSYRLPKDRTLKSISARVVSLPETAPKFSAKKIVRKTTRVVSQPERGRVDLTSSSFSDHLDDICDILDPLVSNGQHRARARVRSSTTDLPHTPSPPSSPESVVIIADKSQLPKDFLRDALEGDDLPVPHTDHGGWITWAKSPPRPIPALHGPLSLPYARCPSGAEGTIIEEQDNLPRMIWGLEGEEDHSNRDGSDSPPRVVHHPHKFGSRQPQAQVPPRFQRMDEALSQQTATRLASKPLQQLQQYVPVLDGHQPVVHKPNSHADIDLSLRGHGPIDLSNVLRPRTKLSEPFVHQPHLQIQMDTRFGRINESMDHGYEDVIGDWQLSLVDADNLKIPSLPTSSSVITEFGDYLAPSGSASSMSSLSSLQSLASSRSPVPLDAGFNRLQATLVPTASRRMSALEIAQNYRQQQIQQKSLLPTPPNSSSPLWASRFSPYQGSSVSPDLQPAANSSMLSGRQFIATNYQNAALRQQNSTHTISQSSPVIDLNSLKSQLDASSLGPAAQIQDPLARIQSLSAYGQDITLANSTGTHLRAQKYPLHRNMNAPAGSVGPRSPAPPRPPPNTPMAPIPSSRLIQNSDRGRARVGVVIDAPPSPTSPNYRLRNMSHQQTRTVPLSHLLSRRLSSVPEEDTTACVASSRSPSPGYSANFRARNLSTGQNPKFSRHGAPSIKRELMLVATNNGHASLRTPSPGYDHLIAPGMLSHDEIPTEYQQPSTRASKARGSEQLQPAATARGRPTRGQYEPNGDNPGKAARGGRANRVRGGGNRGRRGHSRMSSSVTRNGPERVDGGLIVRS